MEMENTEQRIELLEVNKEDTESEIKDIELTISQMEVLRDEKPIGSLRDKIAKSLKLTSWFRLRLLGMHSPVSSQ